MDTLLCISLSFSIIQLIAAMQNEQGDSDDRPSYQFKYQIHDLVTKDYKTHEEVGQNGFVRGTYTVREPNGDLRIVSYTAGDSRGFQAMVRVRPTFATPFENENLEAKQTEPSTLTTSTSDTDDEPLKIQLGTGRRSFNSKQDKQSVRKRQQLTQTPITTVKKEEISPKLVAQDTKINYDLKSQEIRKQIQSFYHHRPQNPAKEIPIKPSTLRAQP